MYHFWMQSGNPSHLLITFCMLSKHILGPRCEVRNSSNSASALLITSLALGKPFFLSLFSHMKEG